MFGQKNVRRIATNRFGTRFICKVKDVEISYLRNIVRGMDFVSWPDVINY